MNSLQEILDPIMMHHAQCVVGDVNIVENALEDVFSILRDEHGVITHVYSFDTLSITDVHHISSLAATKSQSESVTIFSISFSGATIEAQNALLKSIEEPAQGIRFVFTIPRVSFLLPTVKSRCLVHDLVFNNEKSISAISPIEFLDASVTGRIKIVDTVVKNKKEPFSRSDLVIFLKELEQEISNRNVSDYTDALSDIYTFKTYAQLSGCSVKMMLEYLALQLPVSIS